MRRTGSLYPLVLSCAWALFAPFFAGCYQFTIRSGKPPGPTPVDYDEHWHHGFFNGILEVGGRYDLDGICPGGWSEVRTEVSAANGAVEFLQSVALSAVGLPGAAIYNPQTITIVCTAKQGAFEFEMDSEGRLRGGRSLAGLTPPVRPMGR